MSETNPVEKKFKGTPLAKLSEWIQRIRERNLSRAAARLKKTGIVVQRETSDGKRIRGVKYANISDRIGGTN